MILADSDEEIAVSSKAEVGPQVDGLGTSKLGDGGFNRFFSIHSWFVPAVPSPDGLGSWGRCSVGQVAHGPPKFFKVGCATMHLAQTIDGLCTVS